VIRRKDEAPGEEPVRRRRLTAAQRRRLVLDAATRAFAELGYQGASIGQIAQAAGVVASVVYDHFGSKRELYLELLQEAGRALIDRTTRPLPAGSPEELFTANVEAFYQFVEEHPFVWRMIFRDPPADTEIAAAHRDIQDRASAAIAGLVGTVRPGEQVVPDVPRERSDVMIAEGIKAINNALAAWWYEHREIPREQVLAVARTLLWTGLGQVANGPDEPPAGTP
jgi:AcrR family transcriptional regulator